MPVNWKINQCMRSLKFRFRQSVKKKAVSLTEMQITVYVGKSISETLRRHGKVCRKS